MEKLPQLIITQIDLEKLTALIRANSSDAGELLAEELSRAIIVSEDKLPNDVVAMNTLVRYADVETDKESEFTLVFPQDASIDAKKISVLAPIGSALIGLKVGQEIQWPIPNGTFKKIKVVSVSRECE